MIRSLLARACWRWRSAIERRAEGEGKMIAGWTIQPWTPEEDVRLRRLPKEGRTAAAIAERLKRSRAAVYARAAKLDITLKWARAGRKVKL
jgi:hypothetical protein